MLGVVMVCSMDYATKSEVLKESKGEKGNKDSNNAEQRPRWRI